MFHFDFPCICTQISEPFYSLHQKKKTTSCLKSVCLWVVGVFFFSISCLLLEVELVSCPANSGQYFSGEIISGEAQFWGKRGVSLVSLVQINLSRSHCCCKSIIKRVISNHHYLSTFQNLYLLHLNQYSVESVLSPEIFFSKVSTVLLLKYRM